MKSVVVVCCLLASSALTSHATIYSWTDENGNVVYSDMPRPGADAIDLRARVQNVADSQSAGNSYQPQPEKPAHPQPTVAIIDPSDDATIRSAEGNLMISAELTIPAGVTQRLQLLMDGQVQGEPQTATTFVLTGVERGTHQLQLQLVNHQGSVLSASQAIQIHMHRPSKLHPKNSPTVPAPTN
ncbi:hypothetical protein GCM10011369_30550 [Neiella marina]|uniref:DUF4124 domain-containing protein n=1 Tax=Neiella marina TaxID=508461 RepID=A0A8J2U8J6_9GAMM|nr:DUF4124 domain-containing protein [Neiella marina]GGA86385.1 hypothetical protein GCM10011369_30550 [Neiella marina]